MLTVADGSTTAEEPVGYGVTAASELATELDAVVSPVGAGVVAGSALEEVGSVTGSGAVVDAVVGSGVGSTVGSAEEEVVVGVDPEAGVVDRPHLVPAVVKVPP